MKNSSKKTDQKGVIRNHIKKTKHAEHDHHKRSFHPDKYKKTRELKKYKIFIMTYR